MCSLKFLDLLIFVLMFSQMFSRKSLTNPNVLECLWGILYQVMIYDHDGNNK